MIHFWETHPVLPVVCFDSAIDFVRYNVSSKLKNIPHSYTAKFYYTLIVVAHENTS